MTVYVITKQELWEDDYDIIGVFNSFETALNKIPPAATLVEDDDYYVIYEDKENGYLWTITERDVVE